MPEPRLDDPILFRSDEAAVANATRFDYPRLSASPENLRIQFAVLGSINVLVALTTGILILGILRSRILRRQPFDLYVLSIAIPDFVSGFSCMFTCLLSVQNARYVSEAMCGYQSFYLNASVAANAWMNAVIIYQIHKLLRYSHVRRKYIPPTRRDVACHAAAVYLFAIALGTICAIQIKVFGMPLESHVTGGLYCIMVEEKGNSWFYYLVLFSALFMIPSVYAVAAAIHIFWKGLLPKAGKRRAIAIFLMRIILVYLVVFLPLGLSIILGNFVQYRTDWGYFVPALMTHFQGIITASLCYCTNQEMQQSMNRVILCRWGHSEAESAMRVRGSAAASRDPSHSLSVWFWRNPSRSQLGNRSFLKKSTSGIHGNDELEEDIELSQAHDGGDNFPASERDDLGVQRDDVNGDMQIESDHDDLFYDSIQITTYGE